VDVLLLLEEMSTRAALSWVQDQREQSRQADRADNSPEGSETEKPKPKGYGPEANNRAVGDRRRGADKMFIPNAAWRVGAADLVPYTQPIRVWLRLQGRRVRRARQERALIEEVKPSAQSSWGEHGAHTVDPGARRINRRRDRSNDAQVVWLGSLGGPPAASTALSSSGTDRMVDGIITALGLKRIVKGRPPVGPLSVLWTAVHVLSPDGLLWFLDTFAPELHAFGGEALDRGHWALDMDDRPEWDWGIIPSVLSPLGESLQADNSNPDRTALTSAEVDAAAARYVTARPWGSENVQMSALSHMFLHCVSSFLNGPNALTGNDRIRLIDLMVRIYPKQLHDVLMHDIESYEISKQWLGGWNPLQENWPRLGDDKMRKTVEQLGEILTHPGATRWVVPMVADSCARAGIKPTDAVLSFLERAFLIHRLEDTTDSGGTKTQDNPEMAQTPEKRKRLM
jgi:hypothetical protein